jgi:KipI family sensor histidine kinase inhibitor
MRDSPHVHSDTATFSLRALGDAYLEVAVVGGTSEYRWRQINSLRSALDDRLVPGVLDSIATVDRLLVEFDPTLTQSASVERAVLEVTARPGTALNQSRHVMNVAASFGGTDGPDLDRVAHYAAMTPRELVATICAEDLPIRFVAAAGAPMCDSPLGIEVPRLGNPRPRVPAGSIALGATALSIYPVSAPGGWQLIGRTTQVLFDPLQTPPIQYAPGDLLRLHCAAADTDLALAMCRP